MKLASASFLNPIRAEFNPLSAGGVSTSGPIAAKRLYAPSIVTARAQTSYIVAAFELGSFVNRRSVADDIVLSDASLWSLLKGAGETVLLSDQLALARAKQFLDSHRLSDSTNRTVSKGVPSDGVLISDFVTRGLNRALALDPYVLADSLAWSFAAAPADVLRLSDTLLTEVIAGWVLADTFTLSPSSEVVYKEFTSARVEQLTATDTGSLRNQSYVGPAYLSEDYVGASRSF